jgi:sterol desaturase/sphingolipid hydroxylase (fatty acid hydroxylase superfamily)
MIPDLDKTYALTVAGLVTARILFWLLLESRWRAYPSSWRKSLAGDVLTTLLIGFVTIPIADRVAYRLGAAGWLPAIWSGFPMWLRIAAYVVLADLGHYLIHRLMHTARLWRLHRWHHVPVHMNWLAGNRQSLPDRLLVSLPYIALAPILAGTPTAVGTALLVFATLRNDWMHANATLGWPWLEKVMVTPRFHHVHHSTDPQHHHRNFGITFTIWDRLLGTFQDPAGTVGRIRFGIPERVRLYRLYLGL